MRTSIRPVLALFFLSTVLFTVTLSANSDVGVSLTVPKFAPIGGTTTVQVNLTATGGTASDVTFLYAIPSGMTFKSITAVTGVSCTTPSAGLDGPITCHTATLTPAAPLQQPITLNVPINATAGSTFFHQAGVTTGTTDPNSANDQATATQTAQPTPSVQVTSTFPGTFVAGSPLTYNVTVHNSGSAALQNVSLEDHALTASFGDYFKVPATRASGTGFTCSAITPPATVVSCSGGSLAGGGSAVFTVTLETHPLTYARSVEQKATVTFGDFGTTATLDQTAQGSQSSDVSVTASAPAQAAVNTDIPFTVNAREAGPSASGTITFTYALPAGTTFLSLTQSGNSSPAMSCTTPAAGAAGTITCTAHDLRAAVTALGQSEVTAGFVARIRVPAAPATITDSVSVAAPHDTNLSNNTSSADTIVANAPTADLSAALHSSKASSAVGSSVTFTATISNAGTIAAQNAKGTLTIPDGTTAVTVPSPCSIGTVIVCSAGSLAAGSSQAFDIVLTLNTTGTKSSIFTVTSDTPDPDSSNNQATASVAATPRTSDLGVLLGTSQTSVLTGEPFTIQVTVSASGPDTVDSVLTGQFASSLEPLTIDSHCTATGTAITCAATMLPASNVTYTFSFKATEATTYLTTFTVTTADLDPNPANDSATSTVTADVPVTSADVAVSGQAPVAARTNALIHYTFTVENRGPADASNVVFTFTPPLSATIDSFTPPSAMTCQQTNVLTCTAATMTGGTHAAITIVVRMGTVAGSQAVAVAHVTSSSPEPDPTNNDASLITWLADSDFALYADAPVINDVQGYAIAFTIRLLYTGNTPLQNVDIQDTLPPGMTVISAIPSIGTCSGTTTLQCHTDALDAPGLFTVDVVASSPPAGVYVNHVAAASGALSATTDQSITVTATSRRRAVRH
jgi:uncharacterized repeat protein (TIGR01451 family)